MLNFFNDGFASAIFSDGVAVPGLVSTPKEGCGSFAPFRPVRIGDLDANKLMGIVTEDEEWDVAAIERTTDTHVHFSFTIRSSRLGHDDQKV